MGNKKINLIASDRTKAPMLAVELRAKEYAEATVPYAADGNPSEFSMAPVGTHASLTNANLATVQTLIKPEGATMLLAQNTGTAIARYSLGGNNPSSTFGFKLPPDTWSPISIPCPGASIKFIRQADGAIIDYQWTK